MLTAALYAADILAIGILVLGLYFPRHRRRDLRTPGTKRRQNPTLCPPRVEPVV